MKNMLVSKKLIVSFLIEIALAIIVGTVGIIGMNSINIADDALYNGNYLPTVMAGDISQHIVEQRVHMRNFVIYEAESEDFKNSESNMEKIKREMEQLLGEYDGTIVNQEDRNTFDKFLQVYNNEWLQTIDTIYTFGLHNNDTEARTALSAASLTASEIDDLTSRLQDINLSDGENSVNNNTKLFITMAIVEIIILIAAISIAMYLAFYISGLISKPLKSLTKFMQRAGSAGDITLTPDDVKEIEKYSEIKDEVGQCINSTGGFIKHMISISESLGIIANGDLTAKIDTLSEQDVMGLSLTKMVNNLNNMFSEINAATEQVSTGAKQIADGSQALAQGSTEQAASVEELSSTISEIADKTTINAEMASKAAKLAATIKENAENGNRQMADMIMAVQEINQASLNISNVIKVIDDIAFQTNILALNAAVEAARAGANGKGFAVVAEEVRNLAGKSAEAAKNTETLIANSMEKAKLGAGIANRTAESLNEIVLGINESSELVCEIAKSSSEQTGAIAQVNQGIEQVAEVIQRNSATAEESAASSEEMNGQSDMLKELVAQFKIV